MQTQSDFRNGDVMCRSGMSAESGSEEEGDNEEGGNTAHGGELLIVEVDRAKHILQSLNAMRSNRQFYDVLLHTGNAEVPAHRAVLAAVSPYLFEVFSADCEGAGGGGGGNGSAKPSYKMSGSGSAEALRALVEYAYTGELRARGKLVRDVYECAWRLRVDTVRARCADHLVKTLTLDTCLAVRTLPELPTQHRATVDAFIANNFRRLYEGSALAALPVLRLEMLLQKRSSDEFRPMSAPLPVDDLEPVLLAEAALYWLRHELANNDNQLSEMCSRNHMLYLNGEGSLMDCGALPPEGVEAPEVRDYRREKEKERAMKRAPPATATPIGPARAPLFAHQIGERIRGPEWSVIAAHRISANANLALLCLQGQLLQVSVTWRGVHSPSPSPSETEPVVGESPGGVGFGEALSGMERGRCAHGTATLGSSLVVCGGYDRAECLRACEAYEPSDNSWRPLPEMRGARARFGVARLDGRLYAVGGSDGHTELDTVEVLQRKPDGGWCWSRCSRLPLARSQAAVCAVEGDAGDGKVEGAVYCVGGCTGSAGLREAHKYTPKEDKWNQLPPLNTGRQQAAACFWKGAVWVVGGCDAWHCLASTERLNINSKEEGMHNKWEYGPNLPTARRSVAAVVWRGHLAVVGGSDGATSLRRLDWLEEATGGQWHEGPSLRVARAALGVAVLDGALYAVGGFSGKEFLSSMEYLQEEKGQWTTLIDHQRSPKASLHCQSEDGENKSEEEVLAK